MAIVRHVLDGLLIVHHLVHLDVLFFFWGGSMIGNTCDYDIAFLGGDSAMPLTQNPHRCKTDSIANPGSILFRVPLVWGGAMHLPAAQQKDFVNPSPRTASSSSSRTAHHPLLGQALWGPQ